MFYVHFVPTAQAKRDGFLSQGQLPVATDDSGDARQMGNSWLDNFTDTDGTVMSDRWEVCCAMTDLGGIAKIEGRNVHWI